jgi:hypothetical protein
VAAVSTNPHYYAGISIRYIYVSLDKQWTYVDHASVKPESVTSIRSGRAFTDDTSITMKADQSEVLNNECLRPTKGTYAEGSLCGSGENHPSSEFETQE